VTKKLLGLILALAGVLGFAAPAQAQFGGTCTSAELTDIAAKYVQAQTEGLPLYIPMGNWVVYNENFKQSSMSTGVLSTPLKIDKHLVLVDEVQCMVFIEMIAASNPHPYVLAVQFPARGGNAGNFQVISTDKGDWLFDAAATLRYAQGEDWSVIPEAERNTREELIAAADAYLNLFKDKTVQVPWGTPCRRLEGGAYTGKGEPTDSCNVGVPDNIDMANRRYVVDPTIGAVDVFLEMGPNKRPDSHLFRIENGKLRYVHTVTNCGDQDNCGFPPFTGQLPSQAAVATGN
jgi:hypothetical protein